MRSGLRFRKMIAIAMIVCLFLSSLGSVYAASPSADDGLKAGNGAVIEQKQSDVAGHWAEKQLREWMLKGLIKGYGDGNVKPDQPVTRGEFITLVNRSFDFVDEADISFRDLKKTDWDYKEVAKAVKAGYIKGLADGTIRTGNKISRQEAAVILARLLKLDLQQGDGKEAERFKDFAEMASWGKDAVGAIASKGIMVGFANQSFRPLAFISRAEAVVALDRALADQGSVIYDKAGTYGPDSGVQTIHRDVVVGAAGVTLQNMVITGKLLLAEGIGEGDVFLKNVKVEGETTVQGGGANSVHLANSVLVTVIVDKKDGTVRIVAEGSTTVTTVIVRSSVLLEEADSVTGDGFVDAKLSAELPPNAKVSLLGTWRNVDVEAGKISIEIPRGAVGQFRLSEKTEGVNLNLGQDAVIESLVLDAVIRVIGQGKIVTAFISDKAKDSAFEKQPEKKEGPGALTSPPTSSNPTTPPQSGNPISIVKAGAANAVVIVAQDASERTSAAADTLVAYVAKSTGAALPVMTEAQFQASAAETNDDVVRVYVGTAGLDGDSHVANMLDQLVEDGYVIHPHGKNRLTIIGPTDIGTEYGVYEFLERYVGVRWLMPGPDGEDVPQHADLAVPNRDVKDEPAYLSRVLYPLQYTTEAGSNPTIHEWGVHNRLRLQNSGYEHNVWRMFPPDQYAAGHPDYFTQKNGTPYIPGPNWGWQPCYSNPDTVQVAVDWIVDYFNSHPDETSVSLAVNDNGAFCEENPDHLNYTDKKNSLGLTDMSDIYYTWVNEVVEKVLAHEGLEDKWFGLLAYQEVYDPPSFSLHERVVPYLTKDRMAWSDPQVLAKDQAVMAAWNQRAAHIGFYDYTYGVPYSLPRVYNNVMADMFKYGSDNNAIAYFAELFPNIGEGPKPWLMTKLLWNPDQDVDVLTNEWYTRAVGADAAPYLKAYYDHWNDFWENRIKQSGWFQGRKKTTYLNFASSTYLSLVTNEEIAQSRVWLETALAKAVTEQQKKRASLLLRAFEYYEASALSYPKAVEQLNNDAEALELLEAAANFEDSMAYAKKRQTLLSEYANDPVLKHNQYADMNANKMLWSGLNADVFWKLVAYIKADQSAGRLVQHEVEAYAETGQTPSIRNYANLLLRAVREGPNNLNASFEEVSDNDNGKVTAKNWDANILNYGKFERKVYSPQADEVTSGSASIYVKDFYYGDINQTVPAKAGLVISRLKYFVSDDVVSIGDIWLELNLLDENGQKLATFKSEQQPFYNSMGRWETIQIMDVIPSKVNGVSVKSVSMSATVNGFFEGGTLYMDDFELYQANESSELPLISSAEGENGTVRVIFNESPAQAPSAQNLTVKRLDNGEAVTPLNAEWDAASLTATLSLPSVTSQPWEQQVIYEVAYGDEDLIRTNSIVIARTEGYTPVLTNTSFEQWTDGAPTGWWFWGEGFGISDINKRSGQYGVALNGKSAPGAGPIQDIPNIEPGHYVGVYHFLSSAQTGGTLTYYFVLKDANGTNIKLIPAPDVPAASSNGKWKTVSLEFDVESQYNGIPVASAQLLIYTQNVPSGAMVYYDDVELIRYEALPLLASAEAENGTLQVVFNKAPEHTPTAQDFSVERMDNGGPVTPTNVEWDAATLTATLSVPTLSPQPWEMSVAYEIRYGDENTIVTNAVSVARQTGYTSVLANSSFEQWTGTAPDGWWFWGDGYALSNQVKRSGQYGVVLNGQNAPASAPVQDIAGIAPGHYVGVFHFRAPAQSTGTLTYFLVLKNAAGTNIFAAMGNPVQIGTSNDKWTTVSLAFDLGTVYNGEEVASAQLSILTENIQAGAKVYIDDAELIRQN